jgi:hypothetical protein
MRPVGLKGELKLESQNGKSGFMRSPARHSRHGTFTHEHAGSSGGHGRSSQLKPFVDTRRLKLQRVLKRFAVLADEL